MGALSEPREIFWLLAWRYSGHLHVENNDNRVGFTASDDFEPPAAVDAASFRFWPEIFSGVSNFSAAA